MGRRGGCAMKTKRVLLAAVLGAACMPGIYAQEKANAKMGKAIKAVRFGKLWDGKGKLWTNAIVIVEADRIRMVTTDASAIPAGAETIDLSKYTGLPGLIDVHTHMTMYTDETPGEPMLKQLTSNPPAVEVFLAPKAAIPPREAGVPPVPVLAPDNQRAIGRRTWSNRWEQIGPCRAGCGA